MRQNVFLLLALVFSSLVFSSCEKSVEKAILTFNFDLYEINIDDYFVNDYNQRCCLSSFDDKYLAGYNGVMKAIDVYDTEKAKPFLQIKIPSEGPNAIGDLKAWSVSSLSKVILITKNELVYSQVSKDNQLEVISRHDLQDFQDHPVVGFDYDNFQLLTKNTFGLAVGMANSIAFDSKNNKVFLPKYGVIINDYEDKYFTESLGGWIDIRSNTYVEEKVF